LRLDLPHDPVTDLVLIQSDVMLSHRVRVASKRYGGIVVGHARQQMVQLNKTRTDLFP
jgi:hypothetical protein